MFPCTQCGVCCQNISSIKELQAFDIGNGVCGHYNQFDMSCNIYDSRPDICRIDTMYDKVYHKIFSKKEFYEKNAKACNTLQVSCGIDELYRIKI